MGEISDLEDVFIGEYEPLIKRKKRTPKQNRAIGRAKAHALAAARTHCKHGHELTIANTYIYKERRICRACNLAKVKIFQAKSKNP